MHQLNIGDFSLNVTLSKRGTIPYLIEVAHKELGGVPLPYSSVANSMATHGYFVRVVQNDKGVHQVVVIFPSPDVAN